MRSIRTAQRTRRCSTTAACKRTQSADRIQTAFFKAGPGAKAAPGRGPPRMTSCPESDARSVRARPRSPRRQTGTRRKVARAVRFVPAVRDPRAAALVLRSCSGRARELRVVRAACVTPCSGSRGDSSLPAPGACMPVAFRAMPEIPAPRIRPARGARRARPSGSGGRDAPAKTLRTLVSLRCQSLLPFLRAPDSRRSAQVCEAGAFFTVRLRVAAAEFARSRILICARLAARPYTAG